MDAIILTREDADEIRSGLTAFQPKEELQHERKLLDNGSEGVSWLSVVPNEYLKVIRFYLRFGQAQGCKDLEADKLLAMVNEQIADWKL